MRELTLGEIRIAANRPKVRRIAVENFLMTMGRDRRAALANLEMDARLYGWNAATHHAIVHGILLAGGECAPRRNRGIIENRFTVGDPENGVLAAFPTFQQALCYTERQPADEHITIFDVMARRGQPCTWNRNGDTVDYRRD